MAEKSCSQSQNKRKKSSDSVDSTTSKKKPKENQFSWTDSKIQMLLETVKDYKAKQEYEGIDWNSVRTRFEEIRDLFVKSYPSDTDDEHPHVNEPNVFSKDRILLKLKAIRLSFKKELDSGRVSGGGRVVACFYDLCSEIWGGSPAAEDDADLRKNLVSQMKEGDQEHLDYIKSRDQEHLENMKTISTTMNEMTHCISSGFQLLSNIFQQQQSFMNMPRNMQSRQNLESAQNVQPFYNMYQQQVHAFGQPIQGQPHPFSDKAQNDFEM